MNRREFLTLSAASLAGLGIDNALSPVKSIAKEKACKAKDYSVVILGDTHYDKEPASIYHSHYNEKKEWLNRVQRAEFARNGEMWKDRLPRLVKRAACLADDSTKMVFQMGDLVQGDCGDGEVHKKMLGDVMDYIKREFGNMTFVTVVGNHDIRGVGADKAYTEYMPGRMSEELGKPISKTTFDFNIGDDAYLVLDFNHPDDAEVEKILKDTKGARNTFVIVHGPLLPPDDSSCRWFFHGGASKEDSDARRRFRAEFAKRNVICLCGHIHTTEFADWHGDGGRITQMTMNSVWSEPELGRYEVDAEGPEEYGKFQKLIPAKDDGSKLPDESALFEEYRPGLRTYTHSPAAGCYRMTVSGKKVIIDFYAGDSTQRSCRFIVK